MSSLDRRRSIFLTVLLPCVIYGIKRGIILVKATPFLWPILKCLRWWDRKGSQNVDHFVAISHFVAARIRCFYSRKADVIYPPVDASWIDSCEEGEPGRAFLYAGALVPYKRAELAVKVCTELDFPLWVVGTGSEEERLRKIAGPKVRFFGRVSDERLAELYRDCRALIFPGEEDFGIIPLECLAAGRPVIGLYAGALRESLSGVKPWDKGISPERASGVFFARGPKSQEKELIEAICYFIAAEQCFTVGSCQAQAQRFSPEVFRDSWIGLLKRRNLPFLPVELEVGQKKYVETKATAL